MQEFINEYELIVFNRLLKQIRGEQDNLFSKNEYKTELLPDNLYDLCLEIIKKENDKDQPKFSYTKLW